MQEDVAKESETGKVYRASVVDKKGHTVLVMRPANQVIAKLHKLHQSYYPKSSCHKMKLILKILDVERLMGLQVHQDGVKHVDSLEQWSVIVESVR